MLLFRYVFNEIGQTVNALFRQSRCIENRCILHKGQFPPNIIGIFKAGLAVFIDEIPFIDDDDTALTGFMNVSGNLFVLFRHAVYAIED